MERLTRKSQNSDMVWFVDHENNNMNLEPCEMNSHHNRLAIQKLADYEEAEEQGLLLRLPLKVGDTFWELNDNHLEPCVYPRKAHSLQHVVYCIERLGKVTFLTREEAEAALKKMEEEHE